MTDQGAPTLPPGPPPADRPLVPGAPPGWPPLVVPPAEGMSPRRAAVLGGVAGGLVVALLALLVSVVDGDEGRDLAAERAPAPATIDGGSLDIGALLARV